MPTKHQINLNVVLRALDTHNMELYTAFKHKEVERKELERLLGYMLPVWMSSIENSQDQYEMVLRFNEFVNLNWSELKGHPELQAKVLAAIGTGKVVRHDYHMRKQSTVQTKLSDLLLQKYPDIRSEEIGLWCAVNNEAALRELCERYGVQSTERDTIFAQYRRVVG
jgi:hypothetical protein